MGLFFELKLSKAAAAVKFAFRDSNFYNVHKNDDWSEISSLSDTILSYGDVPGEKLCRIGAMVGEYSGQAIKYAEEYPADLKWVKKANEFLDLAFNSKTIHAMTMGSGMINGDLWAIFFSSLLGTMPNPVYKAGCPMLTPVAFFQEEGKRLHKLLKVHADLSTGESLSKRNMLIPVCSMVAGQQLKREHDLAYGQVTLDMG